MSEQRPMPEERALRIAINICGALQHIHVAAASPIAILSRKT